MKPTESQTIEQVLFERMGITVDDAVATGTDFIDESVAQAVASGVNVDERLSGLAQLLQQLTEPATLSALGELVERLPQLAQLAQLADEVPRLLATAVDVLDDFQQRSAADGVDVEKALTNGLHALLYLGSQIETQHLRRVGDLLGSEILNPHALNVVSNAARSLNSAQKQVCGAAPERVGPFKLLRSLRDPQIQRSLAFALQFGKCFGMNLDQPK